MKYVNQVSEIFNAFSPAPLQESQMAEFYCEDTMQYRTSDKYISPIEDIFDICRMPEENNACLLLGHRGCGKSTELNRMAERLHGHGFPVKIIHCSRDLDLLSIVHSDLFILMGEALLQLADELGCRMEKQLLEEIDKFWNEGTETVTSHGVEEISLEAEASAGVKWSLASILSIFAQIKTDLKFNEETRQEYRRKIRIRSSEWIRILGTVADKITDKADGKRPIIIFEDLDRLNPEDAWTVFYNYAAILSGMKFPVIYTFPIALSYDKRFSAMESYFITKTLPMIKIEKIDGQPFAEGIAVIREIVEKRANPVLFENDVLDKLIQYTGGSLRDLFRVINAAAKRAERRDSASIDMEDADYALEEEKTSLTRRIEQKDYPFLLNIIQGNKERIEDKEQLLNMLQATVVLEYNGKRWHNVHPLVVEFLKGQGLMEDVEQ